MSIDEINEQMNKGNTILIVMNSIYRLIDYDEGTNFELLDLQEQLAPTIVNRFLIQQ